jgi:hypothetical protein
VRTGRHRRILRLAAATGCLLAAAATLASASSVAEAAGPRLATTAAVTPAAALSRLLRAGTISQAEDSRYGGAYSAAVRSYGRLSGTRRAELGAVLANVRAIAAAGGFIPSRLPALFLTLERNRQWWTTEPLISSGERISFPGSRIVWEYYAGQGIEIQWLGTFGEANGYFLSGHENANLHQLLGEVLPLATQRAGGIAWEYMFRFDGGVPPWTSGLSQGTALQVLARSYQRFKEPALLEAAQKALGIYEQAPPQGVRVTTPAGAEYAEYTYAPGDRILNGFIQALVGLYDYTQITHDPLGLQLFEAGDAEARAEVPHYDTGAWSLYDQYGESNLNYHELLTEFLQHLCERTRRGEPYTAAPPPTTTTTTTPATTTPTTTPTTTTSPSGGAPAPAASAARAAAHVAQSSAAAAIPGDAIYCTTAEHFTTYLTTPPKVALLTSKLRGGTRAGVQMSLSKLSTVTLTVRKAGRVVWTNSATVERGRPRLLWLTPSAGGTFQVTIAARDLNDNFSTTVGTIVVSRH